jgi:hypothetical protein
MESRFLMRGVFHSVSFVSFVIILLFAGGVVVVSPYSER